MENIFPEYDYTLPERLIAHTPSNERHDARLFVYNTQEDTIYFDTFLNLATFLPHTSVLVLNTTRVTPARLILHTKTGKEISALFLVNEPQKEECVYAILSPKKLSLEEELLGPKETHFTVLSKDGERYYVKYYGREDMHMILESYGEAPLPPYIHTQLEKDKIKDRYQTVFSKEGESVAAPTASLHFTHEVFTQLEKAHIDIRTVRLDVGLGTFLPVRREQVHNNALHSEQFFIDAQNANYLHKDIVSGRAVTAVGTTVVRTIESAYRTLTQRDLRDQESIIGSTQLFIRPGFEFKVTKHLVTNFHVPQSSLMCLVDAFLVHKKSTRRILDLYKKAIEAEFRFYSFGDSMLIL